MRTAERDRVRRPLLAVEHRDHLAGPDADEIRLLPLEMKPDLCSLDVGSLNFRGGVFVNSAAWVGSSGNGRWPVSASYSMTPTLYQSHASVTASPRACSGAM